MGELTRVPGSFRDPSGFLFLRDGTLYRQVNQVYRPHYEILVQSGLYATLVERGLLVRHQEVAADLALTCDAYRVTRPDPVPFVSYPYEWCFGQLHAAALATLAVHRSALEHGMSLKDASAYNIQFCALRPVLIDTLSFERLDEGRPWVAYRQFCSHFLAPLALMAFRDLRLGQLARVFLDGVPIDLASRLLPWRTRLRPWLLVHLHLHARSQAYFADRPVGGRQVGRRMSLAAMLGLVDSLESALRGLRPRCRRTAWSDYSGSTSYSAEAFADKERLVAAFLDRIAPSTVWDLGANIGHFSRLAASRGAEVVAFDLDPAAVERGYQEGLRRGQEHVLPLVLDLTNPSPGIGWENRERQGLLERGPVDAILALALIHHLVIANNLPLERVARLLARLAAWLVVELVPKSDPQLQRMLATRDDIFPDYTPEGFERAFAEHFALVERHPLRDSQRVLYLMRRRDA